MTWLILGVYAVGWFLASVQSTRHFASLPECHREGGNGYKWNLPECQQFHRHNCWRTSDMRAGHVLQGASVALIWPVVLPLALVYFAAVRPPRSRRTVELQQTIDHLERELGIGGKP